MPATLRELLIKVGFDVKKEGLDKAEKSVVSLHRNVMWLVTGITAISTALFGLVISASKAGSELDQISKTIGINVETLQRLKEGANLAGVDFRNLVISLKFFGRAVGEAMNGNKQFAQNLREAGIVTLRDQNGQIKNQIELLKEVAEKIKNTTNVQQRLALIQNIFGRSGAAVVAFLKDGAAGIDTYMRALDDYGVVLTKTQIKAAKSFNIQRKELLIFIRSAKNEIGISLIPTFNKLIASLLKLIKVNKELIIQKLEKFFQGLASIIGTVVLGLWELGKIVNNLVKSTIGWNHVLEIAGVLLGLLITNTIINSFKSLYSWIIKLAEGAGLLDIALAPLNIILVAIAAAFYLAWDDLKNFEEGNISLIGTLKKSHPIIANFIKVLGGLAGFIKNLIVGTVDDILDVIKLFIKVSGWLDRKLARIPIIGKMFKKMGQDLQHPGKMVNDILKTTANNLEQINKATDPAKIRLGAQPGYKYFLQAQAAGTKTTTVTNNVEVSMTVPPGTPKDQQEWLQRATREHLDDYFDTKIKGVFLASPLHEGT